MKKKFTVLLLVICIALVGTLFINAANDDFEKETGGKHQIKNFSIITNNDKEAKIELTIVKSSKDKMNPSVKMLTEDDLIYEGENEVKDPELGKYRVAIEFTDVRLQKALANDLGHTKRFYGKKGQDILECVKVAYPPDDSLMVIYLGCNDEPQTQIDEQDDKIVITLKNKI